MGSLSNIRLDTKVRRAIRSLKPTEKAVKFIVKNEFKVPEKLKDPAKWARDFASAAGGVVSHHDVMSTFGDVADASVKDEIDAVTEEFASYELTEELEKKLPEAIKKYEVFCKDAKAKAKKMLNVLSPKKGVTKTKAEKVEEKV